MHARQRPPLLLPHRLPPLPPSRSRQRLALVSGCWARHDACHRASKLTKLTKLTKPPSPLRVPLPPLAHLRRPIRRPIRANEPVKLIGVKLVGVMLVGVMLVGVMLVGVMLVAEAMRRTTVLRPRSKRRLGRHPRR